MKKLKLYTSIFIFFCAFNTNAQQTWIRVNQLGYLNNDVKIAVLVSKDKNFKPRLVSLHDALNGASVGFVYAKTQQLQT